MILNSNWRGTVWNNQGVFLFFFFFFFFKFYLKKLKLRLFIPIIEKWGTPEWLSRKISEYGRMCQFIQIINSARKSVWKKARNLFAKIEN